MTEADITQPKNFNYLLGSTDAQQWAKGFYEVIKDREGVCIDEGLILTWFANAIEAGRISDEAKLRQAVKDEHDRGIVALGYLSVVLNERSVVHQVSPSPGWFPTMSEFLDLWEEGYLHGVIEDDNDDQE